MPTLSCASSQFEEWNHSLRSICGNFRTEVAQRHSLFIGEVRRQELDGLEVAHIRTNAGLIARERVRADGDDDRHCFLIFQRSGRQHIRQGDRSIELIADDLALVDSATAFEIEPHGLIENLSFHLSRDQVTRQFAGRRLFGRLSRSGLSGRMIRALLQSVSSGSEPRDGDGRALQDALLALLQPALVEDREEGIPAAGNLYGLALQLIDESLQNNLLGPEFLASRLHVSVRRLYRIFEEQGDSICRHIQQARLNRVARDLQAGNLRHESITQLAFKWGFSDAAHFSRAFKRQFSSTPRDYRALTG